MPGSATFTSSHRGDGSRPGAHGPTADLLVRGGLIRGLLAGAVVQLVSACSWLDVVPDHPAVDPPAVWSADADANTATPLDGWLYALGDPQVAALATRAASGNRDIAEARAALGEARAAVAVAGADRWPSVAFNLSTARRQAGVDFSRSSSVAETALGASFELDLWGRLSDAERGAVLAWRAEEARYSGVRLATVSAVASGWYELLEAERLVALFDQRLANLEQNLGVIESSYRAGLTPALDVYLARNEVEQERGRLAEQRQSRDAVRRRVELALGDYPAAALANASTDPAVPDSVVATGLPSDLLTRRPDVRAAWLELLAGDAAVAVAHKDRFPRLTLTAEVGRSALELVELASNSNLVWSLAAGLTQPVFDAGRLAALEAQARARVQVLEQQYLRTVFSAFGEVEEALSQEQALRQRYRATRQAEDNALAAQTLAFEQYRGGLIDYPTVLEAQRRAFDAQSQVIALRAALVRNRIALHQALAGAPLGT